MKKIIFFMICFQYLGLNYAVAADITQTYSGIYIDGEIKQGDYEKLKQIITHHFIEQTVENNLISYVVENKDKEIIIDGEILEYEPSDSERKDIELIRSAYDGKLLPRFELKTVNLNSPGGSVLESMLIGESIHKSLLSTKVDRVSNREHSCQSSCFLVWASGVERKANTMVPQSVAQSPINDLGVHRVYFDPTEYSNYSGLQAISEYSSIKNTVSDFLLSMNIDKSIVEKMWKYSSNEMYFLTGNEKISLVGMAPFYEELLLSKCGAYKREEKKLVGKCKNDYPIILENNQVGEQVVSYTDKGISKKAFFIEYAYTDSTGSSAKLVINSKDKEKLLGVCPSISPSRIEELLSSYDDVDNCKRIHSEVLRWEAVNSTFGITKEYPKLLGESFDFYLDASKKGLNPELFR